MSGVEMTTLTLRKKLEFLERRMFQNDIAVFLGVSDRSVRRWRQLVGEPTEELRSRIESLYGTLRKKRVPKTRLEKRKVFYKLAGLVEGETTWFAKRKVLDKLIIFPVDLPVVDFLHASNVHKTTNNIVLRVFLRDKFELTHTTIHLKKDDEEDDREDDGEGLEEKQGVDIHIGQRLHLTREGLEGLTWELILADLHGLKYRVVLVKIDYHGKTERLTKKPRGVSDAKKPVKTKNK